MTKTRKNNENTRKHNGKQTMKTMKNNEQTMKQNNEKQGHTMTKHRKDNDKLL